MKTNLEILFIIILSVSLSHCSNHKKGHKIVIAGSTTIEPLTRLAVDIYKENHNVDIKIKSIGSHSGILALINSNCDIADSSIKITKKEMEKALSRGIKIKEFLIAYDLIVPIVHPENPIRNVNMSELKDIYTGKVSNWRKMGWADTKINVVTRDKNSGTYDVWNEIVLNKGKEAIKSIQQPSNSGVLSYVSQNTASIGYISYSFINSDVNPLQVNGIKASIDIKKTIKYPIYRKLYLYVNENRFSRPVQSFIIFLLSKKGQKLIIKAGFIPFSKGYGE